MMINDREATAMCLLKEIRIALLLALSLGVLSTGHTIPAPAGEFATVTIGAD